MTITPEIMHLLETLAPYVASGVGFLLMSIFSALAAVGRYLWKQHLKRMELMATATTKLAQALKDYKDASDAEHQRVWKGLEKLGSELKLARLSADNIKENLNKTEGALQAQTKRVDDYIKQMGVMEATFKKVFEYIDAKKRATDAAIEAADAAKA